MRLKSRPKSASRPGRRRASSALPSSRSVATGIRDTAGLVAAVWRDWVALRSKAGLKARVVPDSRVLAGCLVKPRSGMVNSRSVSGGGWFRALAAPVAPTAGLALAVQECWLTVRLTLRWWAQPVWRATWPAVEWTWPAGPLSEPAGWRAPQRFA